MKQNSTLLLTLVLFAMVAIATPARRGRAGSSNSIWSKLKPKGRALSAKVEIKCKTNASFSMPHIVKGFWLRSGMLEDLKTKKCLHPGEKDAVKGVECKLKKTQLWNLAMSPKKPRWFSIKTNGTKKKCLHENRNALAISECGKDVVPEQHFAFIQSEYVEGHHFLVNMAACKCLLVSMKDGALSFAPCDKAAENPTKYNPYWVLERTKQNCKKKPYETDSPVEGGDGDESKPEPEEGGEPE